MKKMNIEETRTINGGYYCRLCDYTRDSWWSVYGHVLATHTLPIGLSILDLIL